MTGYQTKIKLSESKAEQAVTEFLNYSFDDFSGRHTFWELLYEPPHITAATLNRVQADLLGRYRAERITVFESDKKEMKGSIMGIDLN